LNISREGDSTTSLGSSVKLFLYCTFTVPNEGLYKSK